MDTNGLNYAEIIKKVLNDYLEYAGGNSLAKTHDVPIFDDENQAYTIFSLGWWEKRRIQILIVLMRIVGDKIYVEDDNTDYIFVDYLLEAGVPKENIVLAWHAPHLRQYTEYAPA